MMRWLSYLLPWLVINLLAYPAAFVAPLCANKDGWLPDWLWWFQTPDNPLDGDAGWKNEHWQWRYDLPTWLATYIGRVGWLLRNPAYGFEMDGPLSAYPITASLPVSFTGNPDIKNRNNAIAGTLTVKVGPWWCWKRVTKPLFGDTCLMLEFGWKLQPYVQPAGRSWRLEGGLGRAQFVCSIRLTAFYSVPPA